MNDDATSRTTSTGTRPAPTLDKSTAGPSPTAAGPDLSSEAGTLSSEAGTALSADADRSVVGGAAERIEHRRNLVESRSRSFVVLGAVGVLATALVFGIYLFFAGV